MISTVEATNPAKPVGSLSKVIDRTVNPGYPFWIAGMEDIVGQRPPTPVLDMLSTAQATALKNSGNSSSATFRVKTSKVRSSVAVTISASANNSSASAVLTVVPR